MSTIEQVQRRAVRGSGLLRGVAGYQLRRPSPGEFLKKFEAFMLRDLET